MSAAAAGRSIPARIHRIWLGSPVPADYAPIWEAWAKLFPGYELLTWREEELERLGLPPAFYEARTYAERSDIARLRVVDAYGGMYADCDVEPLRRFDDLWTSTDRLVAFEQEPDFVCNGLFAAAPGALSFVSELVERNARRSPVEAAPVVRTGPFAVTAALRYLLSRDPRGIRVYPPAFLDLTGNESQAVARTRFRDPPLWTPVREGDVREATTTRRLRAAILELRLLPLRVRRRLRARGASDAR
jgi:mannosyltransferase OCH1-like enzyme